jgi:hypothetical protein
MAWDTSILTVDVHRRLAAGETIEQIAASITGGDGKPLHPDAVRQYIRKIDADGHQINHNNRRRPWPQAT